MTCKELGESFRCTPTILVEFEMRAARLWMVNRKVSFERLTQKLQKVTVQTLWTLAAQPNHLQVFHWIEIYVWILIKYYYFDFSFCYILTLIRLFPSEDYFVEVEFFNIKTKGYLSKARNELGLYQSICRDLDFHTIYVFTDLNPSFGPKALQILFWNPRQIRCFAYRFSSNCHCIGC